MAPRTQAVDADGGAACGVRGRAASAGRSLPAPGRLGREAPGRDWPGRVPEALAAPEREEGRPVLARDPAGEAPPAEDEERGALRGAEHAPPQ